jgi:hypothetical protein
VVIFNAELEKLISFWQFYLEQAKEDLSSKSKKIRNSAKAWFRSSGREIGSFLWVCDIVNAEPEEVKKDLKFSLS